MSDTESNIPINQHISQSELSPLIEAERVFQDLWLKVPFERRMPESDLALQSFGLQIRNILQKYSQKKRLSLLEFMKSYSQLCFLASESAAIIWPDLTISDPVEHIKTLAQKVPVERQYCVSWLLYYATQILIQNMDKNHDAAKAFMLATQWPGSTALMWIKAVEYLVKDGQIESAIFTAKKALTHYPFDQKIIEKVLPFLKAYNKADIQDYFIELADDSRYLDPEIFIAHLNQLAVNNKLQAVFDLFVNYWNAGAQINGMILNNGLFPLHNGVKPSIDFQTRVFPGLIQDCLLRSEIRQCDEAIIQLGVTLDIIPEHRRLFLDHANPWINEHIPALHSQMLWHSLALSDDVASRRIMSAIDRMIDMDSRYLDRHVYTLTNLVCAASRFEERDRALEYCLLLRRLDYSRFLTLYRDSATKFLWHEKEFEFLFEFEPDDEGFDNAYCEPDIDE